MSISVLYLAGNPILYVEPSLMGQMASLKEVDSYNNKLCCLAKEETLCTFHMKVKGSCSTLLKHNWLNGVQWFVGGVIVISNGLVLVS